MRAGLAGPVGNGAEGLVVIVQLAAHVCRAINPSASRVSDRIRKTKGKKTDGQTTQKSRDGERIPLPKTCAFFFSKEGSQRGARTEGDLFEAVEDRVHLGDGSKRWPHHTTSWAGKTIPARARRRKKAKEKEREREATTKRRQPYASVASTAPWILASGWATVGCEWAARTGSPRDSARRWPLTAGALRATTDRKVCHGCAHAKSIQKISKKGRGAFCARVCVCE